jgi:NADH:ubiquinone oxidoreductase subunit H
MAQRKKHIPSSRFTDSWLYLALPFKARVFFLSRLSERYLGALRVPLREAKEETVVGYESSWSGVYKKVQ